MKTSKLVAHEHRNVGIALLSFFIFVVCLFGMLVNNQQTMKERQKKNFTTIKTEIKEMKSQMVTGQDESKVRDEDAQAREPK